MLGHKTSAAIGLRTMEPGDMEQIAVLYRAVFGSAYTDRFLKRWTWAHSDNLFPDESPKWVLVDGHRIVGFLASIPQPYSIGGECVIAHTPCDYMVHANYRFHGIKLMKQFFDSCPNCVTCDEVPATIKVSEWLGAKVAAPLVTYLKVLDSRALHGRGWFPTLPDAAYSVGTLGLRLLDGVHQVAGSRIELESVSDFDERFQQFFERTGATIPATVSKSPRFLRWRYGEGSPHAESEIVAATAEDGQLQGYAVLYLASSPRPSGYILDLQTVSEGQDEVTHALLRYAVQRFRQSGALTMRYHALPSAFAPPPRLLRRMGFMARNYGRRVLMAKLADPRLDRIASQASNWQFSYGDAEASHSLA